MTDWLPALANLGGGFALAAVILRLHREALRAFRTELAEERKTHALLAGEIRQCHHDQMEALRRLELCPVLKAKEKDA